MKHFLLDNNRLSGYIPKSLGTCTNLETISVEYNQHLTGTIPESLSSLTDLHSLLINNNQLTGTVPSSFGTSLSSLRYLHVHANQLTGNFDAIFCRPPFVHDLQGFTADCAGGNPEIVCGCCTRCYGNN